MVILRPVQATDARELFPLIYGTSVTDTLAWDGPNSYEEFEQSLMEREQQTRLSLRHVFTIIETESEKPAGIISIRPDAQNFRGEIGLWLGEPYQGKGYGTYAVRKIVECGFKILGMEKIEAWVYTGNRASRWIFEKNGFSLEGTIRSALLKHGQPQDDWLLGLTRPEYEAWQKVILHLASERDWKAAQADGAYNSASLKSEVFIHCSRPEQILDVANRFYLGAQNLFILWVELDRLQPVVRWEPIGRDDYPHVYGPINLDAITAVTPYPSDTDGRFRQFPRR